jgi:hypothetical protein
VLGKAGRAVGCAGGRDALSRRPKAVHKPEQCEPRRVRLHAHQPDQLHQDQHAEGDAPESHPRSALRSLCVRSDSVVDTAGSHRAEIVSRQAAEHFTLFLASRVRFSNFYGIL